MKPNCSRPQSIYSKRSDNEIFYTNKSVNDYFTKDFKDLAKNFHLFQPRFVCKPEKMKSLLMNLKNKELIHKNYSKINLFKKDYEPMFNNKVISSTTDSGNLNPLLNSILIHTQSELLKEGLSLQNQRRYFNSNKPLGNSKSHINFKINLRDSYMRELKSIIII